MLGMQRLLSSAKSTNQRFLWNNTDITCSRTYSNCSPCAQLCFADPSEPRVLHLASRAWEGCQWRLPVNISSLMRRDWLVTDAWKDWDWNNSFRAEALVIQICGLWGPVPSTHLLLTSSLINFITQSNSMMATLIPILVISTPNFWRFYCLASSRQELDWNSEEIYDLSFPSMLKSMYGTAPQCHVTEFTITGSCQGFPMLK